MGLAALAVPTVLAAGCASEGSPAGTTTPLAVGHVHGLGIDPADDTLYVAAHGGVFRMADGGPELVADRAQDTMGFTVVGANKILASGHPDPTETDRPSHLGLIGSTDAAQSWEELSLAGEADFHALDKGAEIYGYDSLSGTLRASADGRSWRTLWTGQAVDIAAAPDTDQVLVTTPRGEVLSVTSDGTARQLDDVPPMFFLDRHSTPDVVGVDAEGQVWSSADAAVSWEQVGEPLGVPQALDTTEEVWHVATGTGVFSSVDEGQTWDPILRFGEQ